MITVLSKKSVRESDAAKIASGTPGVELMKRAAEGIAKYVDITKKTAIVCGPGNNGGDGHALAEILCGKGVDCTVFLLSDKFSPDGKYYSDRCAEKGVKTEYCGENTDFSGFDTVVDCIFGTGFKGAPHGTAKTVIEKINESGKYVISADINSGLDSDSGLCDVCVISDLTVSIGFFKPGHFLGMAKDKIKRKVNVDIGLDAGGTICGVLEKEDAAKAVPQRPAYCNKSDFGYIALIGGSKRYGGALKLACMANAAMRSGAGVVKAAAPDFLADRLSGKVLESTVFPLSSDGECIAFNETEIKELIQGVRSVAFGMGAGRGKGVADTLCYLLENFTGTLIIDADGLNALSRVGAEKLKTAKCKTVLTPHVKEFSRLTGLQIGEILSDPIRHAFDFAKEYASVVLLKGTATVITDGKTVYITDTGCPGMATAGSGDVLSGITAALCGYNKDALTAAAAAYINGMAGELAQKKTNCISMIASDTVSSIPDAITKLLN